MDITAQLFQSLAQVVRRPVSGYLNGSFLPPFLHSLSRLARDCRVNEGDSPSVIALRACRPHSFFANQKKTNYAQSGLNTHISYRGNNDLLSLSYSNVNTLDKDEKISDGYNSDEIVAMYVPEHALILLYGYRCDNDWQVSTSLFHVDAVCWSNDAGDKNATSWANLKISKAFNTEGGNAYLSITLQNVVDEVGVTLRESGYEPARGGRRNYATLRQEL